MVENVDQQVTVDEGITEVSRIHPPGTINACSKFYGNPSSC